MVKSLKPKPKTPPVILCAGWDTTVSALTLGEKNSLYNIAGYIVYSLDKNCKVCSNCLSSLASKTRIDEEYTKLVELREFKPDHLFYVKERVFEVFMELELLFRSYESSLPKLIECRHFLIDKFQENRLVQDLHLPQCHEIKKKMLSRFASFRLKIFDSKLRKQCKKSSCNMGSKSVAMRDLAKNV
ncbi:hypothetical protein JTE90_017814 [Oedothorax gibbosus]|uniref:Uncharacterized protein n=1 Tax=Oedothorax gibbosus TaxID=931172 RepID=A0AAV6U7T8_9ARAC|nr:hypothetical protein JTE90_017814 [Oedothorax gibbosus]